MNKEQATEVFWRELRISCPECNTPEGQLCDTPALWVHLERILAAQAANVKRHARLHEDTFFRIIGSVSGHAMTIEKDHDYTYGKSKARWRKLIERNLPANEERS